MAGRPEIGGEALVRLGSLLSFVDESAQHAGEKRAAAVRRLVRAGLIEEWTGVCEVVELVVDEDFTVAGEKAVLGSAYRWHIEAAVDNSGDPGYGSFWTRRASAMTRSGGEVLGWWDFGHADTGPVEDWVCLAVRDRRTGQLLFSSSASGGLTTNDEDDEGESPSSLSQSPAAG